MTEKSIGWHADRVISLFIRLFVWGLLFGIIFLLRSFFLLMFLTFIFAYIQGHAVRRLKPYVRLRPARVVLVAGLLLAVLAAVGAYLVPAVKEQARTIAVNYPTYLAALDREILGVAEEIGAENLLNTETAEPPPSAASEGGWDYRSSPTILLVQALLGSGSEAGGPETLTYLADAVTDIGGQVLGVISAFLLSLLFSFLIVLDLPSLARATADLSRTKVAFIYDEVAESIATFSQELGRAFEAQTLIALVNTILTAIGLWLLGITGKTAFLSMVVFFCSFVPIAGVFISSVPICLFALQQSGPGLMLLAILMITVVHLIEAYILNPRIYGHHLRLNPVLVLVILTIGGKLFGVWGLVLGIPICTYFFRHAIRFKAPVHGKAVRA